MSPEMSASESVWWFLLSLKTLASTFKISPTNHMGAQSWSHNPNKHENVSIEKTELGKVGVIRGFLNGGIYQNLSTGPYRILQETWKPFSSLFTKPQTSLSCQVEKAKNKSETNAHRLKRNLIRRNSNANWQINIFDNICP